MNNGVFGEKRNEPLRDEQKLEVNSSSAIVKKGDKPSFIDGTRGEWVEKS